MEQEQQENQIKLSSLDMCYDYQSPETKNRKKITWHDSLKHFSGWDY